ncbi:MAG: hypothetical protein BZY88_00585 [SAR202 cluster bacterium Io17-Chloro-G9]|nr:MAG: hypothetical protein BZY88_00585 [SAR202 cluster bacterium Io17-Chloro-G9]
MAEEESKEDFEKIEFTPEGESLGYISLEQARLLAMQTARDDPGNYGRRFSGSRMVFDVAEQEDGEDYYIVTLSFRPEGDFAGTTGQEQFFIEKEGAVAHRQVLSLPSAAGGKRLPIVPIGIGLVVVIIIAVVGVAFAVLSSSSEEPSAEVAAPTNTLLPPQAATQGPTATAVRFAPTPTRALAVIVQPTPTSAPTPTSVIVRRVQAPTPTSTSIPLVRLRITPVPTAVPRILVPLVRTPTPTPTPARLQIVPNVGPRPVQFTTQDGITLSGQLFNGGGELAVILSHAFPTDQRSWTAFARRLAEDHDYVVLTFDFRGYGESGGDTIIPDIDRDVRAALRFARERGAERVVLIGASMGGTASLRVAATETVEGVVAISALEGFRGLTMGERTIRWPVLLLAEAGDLSAARSFKEMLDSGLLGGSRSLTTILYPQGDSHGTDIFLGPNGPDARRKILELLAVDAGG